MELPVITDVVIIDDDVQHTHYTTDSAHNTGVFTETDRPNGGSVSTVRSEVGEGRLSTTATNRIITGAMKRSYGIPMKPPEASEDSVLYNVTFAGSFQSEDANEALIVELGCGFQTAASISTVNPILRPRRLPLVGSSTGNHETGTFSANLDVLVKRPDETNTRRNNPFWFYFTLANFHTSAQTILGTAYLRVRAHRKPQDVYTSVIE